MKHIVRNGRILTGDGQMDTMDICMENGMITKIGGDINAELSEVIDAQGCLVLPGFIDLNCNICDPGYEYKEDIVTVSRSAAKGGFTSITCSPVTYPVIDNKTVVNYIISKSARLATVNIFPYGNMTKGGLGEEIAEIGEMHKAGVVGISDGNISVFDADLMRNIMLYSNMFKIPVVTFCENKLLSGVGVMNRGRVSTKIGLSGNPAEAEETFIARNLILARHTNARLHITHVSTGVSVDLIRFAKKNGVDVTCDTCPHYFSLSEEAVEDYNTYAKVNPPLRTKNDAEAVIGGLADGTIDAIVSGHSPTTVESKQAEFAQAAVGISSLETVFALSYTALVETGRLSLAGLVSKLAWIPARILGLESKGMIKEGMDADITIIDEKAEYSIEPARFASKAKFSPHAGVKVRGDIKYTFVNGEVVYLQ